MHRWFNPALLSISVCVLTACNTVNVNEAQPTATTGTSMTASPAKLSLLVRTLKTASACTAKGGNWQKVGRLQAYNCVLSASDAGKACADNKQCQVSCTLPPGQDVAAGTPVTGQCHATTNEFGCLTRVIDGRAGPTLCID